MSLGKSGRGLPQGLGGDRGGCEIAGGGLAFDGPLGGIPGDLGGWRGWRGFCLMGDPSCRVPRAAQAAGTLGRRLNTAWWLFHMAMTSPPSSSWIPPRCRRPTPLCPGGCALGTPLHRPSCRWDSGIRHLPPLQGLWPLGFLQVPPLWWGSSEVPGSWPPPAQPQCCTHRGCPVFAAESRYCSRDFNQSPDPVRLVPCPVCAWGTPTLAGRPGSPTTEVPPAPRV